MADKKINQLDPASDAQANDDTRFIANCNPTTGVSLKQTIAQAKAVFLPKKLKYVATGSEGSTITSATLAGKDILLIIREIAPIFEVASAPDSSEFTWDGADIDLGSPVSGAGERFLILYCNL